MTALDALLSQQTGRGQTLPENYGGYSVQDRFGGANGGPAVSGAEQYRAGMGNPAQTLLENGGDESFLGRFIREGWGSYEGRGMDSNGAQTGMASNGAQTGMANPAQQLMGQSSAYDGNISRLMSTQGMTRDQAIANQASAVRQGSDFNNDGTVGAQEWQRFQQNPSLTAPTTGVIGSEMALGTANDILKRGGNQALTDLLAGTQQSRSDINTASQAALQPLNSFAQAGQGANTLQGNLLGANGYGAQAQAMQNFQNSPGQDFLRQEQERAVLRNAAATGGTQGGAVLEELQRRAFGRAGTAFNDRISQLGQLGDQGLLASQGLSGILGDTGMALSGLSERGSGNLANTRLGIAGQQAGIQGTIAGGRTRAGELMAQNVGNTTANLSTLQNQQGAGLADLLDGGQFAAIMQQAGITDATTQQQLATLLANIATGQGSQSTGLGGIPGITETKGYIGRLTEAIGTGIKAANSDIRLKDNITPAGSYNGLNFYTWDWNETGKQLADDDAVTFGVLAQEVMKTHPESVIEGDHGYLMVNYGSLLNG